MTRLTRLTRLAPLAAALVLAISVPMTAVGFETPEEAIREYVEGVASADIGRVLETSAVDEMAEGYRFDQQVERLRGFTLVMAGPVHSPFFRDIQRAGWRAELLGQTRMLVYSLLAPDSLGDALWGWPLEHVDAAWAADLVGALDEARLSNLIVTDIAVPAPEYHNSSRNLENLARKAIIYGADEQTERVALLDFEGDTYVVGFTLLRYGDDWKVSQQASAMSGLNTVGAAVPMTIEEFTELTSE